MKRIKTNNKTKRNEKNERKETVKRKPEDLKEKENIRKKCKRTRKKKEQRKERQFKLKTSVGMPVSGIPVIWNEYLTAVYILLYRYTGVIGIPVYRVYQ